MFLRRLEELRIENGKTQRQIADIISCELETYRRYETGSAKIPVRKLIVLTDYYQTSMDYILNVTDTKKPHPRNK